MRASLFDPDTLEALRAGTEAFITKYEASGEVRFDVRVPEQIAGLLDSLECRDRRVAATVAALAVVRREGKHPWPPPSELLDYLVRVIESADLPSGQEVELWMPEFVLAVCLGFRRCVDPAACPLPGHAGRLAIRPEESKGWLGRPRGARQLMWRHFHRHVAYCLECLAQTNRRSGVPGFATEEPRNWTDAVLNRYLAHGDGCHCWDRAEGGQAELRGNARSKCECCARQHHLDSWDPLRKTKTAARETLWYHAERAVKGFVGPFRHEGFPTGMLRAALAGEGLRLERRNVVRRQCPLCGWTVRMSCLPGHPDPGTQPLTSRNWLVLFGQNGADGGFVEGRFWRCGGKHLHPEDVGQCPVSGCPCEGQARPTTNRLQRAYYMR